MLEGELASWALLGRERPNRPITSPGALDCGHWENGKSTSFPKENPQGYGKSPELTNPTHSWRLLKMQIARSYPGPNQNLYGLKPGNKHFNQLSC